MKDVASARSRGMREIGKRVAYLGDAVIVCSLMALHFRNTFKTKNLVEPDNCLAQFAANWHRQLPYFSVLWLPWNSDLISEKSCTFVSRRRKTYFFVLVTYVTKKRTLSASFSYIMSKHPEGVQVDLVGIENTQTCQKCRRHQHCHHGTNWAWPEESQEGQRMMTVLI